MATTSFASGDPQTRKVWSTLTFMQALRKTHFWNVLGSDARSIVYRKMDLEKGNGDAIRFDLLAQLTGYGVNNDDALETNEDAHTYYQDEIKIAQKRRAVAWFRQASQFTVHNLRKDGMANLSDVWARMLDEYLGAHLSGVATGITGLAADITDHGANALVAVDAAHILDRTSVGTFDPDFISEARTYAEQLATPLKKVRVEEAGMDVYVMFVHPWAALNLRKSDKWHEGNRIGDVRGMKNRIFTGALGLYDGVVVRDYPYLPYDATPASEITYNALCGAQAACVAFGNPYSKLDQKSYGKDHMMSWVEEEFDYGNRRGVSLGAIFGVKRTIFNSATYGVVQVRSRDVAVS